MRKALARLVRRPDLIAAAALLSALTACAREAPTELTLQASEAGGFFDGPPPSGRGPLGVTGQVGQPDTIALLVVDQTGRTAPGVRVSWAVVGNGGTTDVASSTTDSSGTARVAWTLDTIVKTDSLRASIASGDTMLVVASARHGNARIATKISGDSQTVAPGESSQPLVVRLADRYGNPIGGAAVAWFATGDGTLSASTTATGADGTTEVTLNTDASASAVYQVIATYGVVPASIFTLTAARAIHVDANTRFARK